MSLSIAERRCSRDWSIYPVISAVSHFGDGASSHCARQKRVPEMPLTPRLGWPPTACPSCRHAATSGKIREDFRTAHFMRKRRLGRVTTVQVFFSRVLACTAIVARNTHKFTSGKHAECAIASGSAVVGPGIAISFAATVVVRNKKKRGLPRRIYGQKASRLRAVPGRGP